MLHGWIPKSSNSYLKKLKYTDILSKRRSSDVIKLREIQARCKSLIKKWKTEYYKKLSDSLNDPLISSKKYWSVLHRFLNKQKSRQKTPIRHDNTVVTDFSVKANIFHSFFNKQCSLLKTDSSLPDQVSYISNKRLDSVTLDAKICQLFVC